MTWGKEGVLGPVEEPGEVRLWLKDSGQGGKGGRGQGAWEEFAKGGGKVKSWEEGIVREQHVHTSID